MVLYQKHFFKKKKKLRIMHYTLVVAACSIQNGD